MTSDTQSAVANRQSEIKTDALFGGRTVTVTFNDGTVADIKVRQLPLAEYEKAFTLLNDELALTALACGQPKEWLLGGGRAELPLGQDAQQRVPTTKPGVSPESYELLQAAAREVNANGFFAWSARRAEREADAQAQMMQALAALPPEAIEQIAQLGMVAVRKDTLPMPSPKRR